jgi:hypothetical protein
MPRWNSEELPGLNYKRDLLGFPAVQTQTLDSQQATVFEGTQREELEQQLHEGAQRLKRINETYPVAGVHPHGQKLPPEAVLQTDWSEKKKALWYTGYLLGEKFIQFARPFPCNPPKEKK